MFYESNGDSNFQWLFYNTGSRRGYRLVEVFRLASSSPSFVRTTCWILYVLFSLLKEINLSKSDLSYEVTSYRNGQNIYIKTKDLVVDVIPEVFNKKLTYLLPNGRFNYSTSKQLEVGK